MYSAHGNSAQFHGPRDGYPAIAAAGRHRTPLILGLLAGTQVTVVLGALALRLVTPGWMFVMLLFGGFLVVLAPIVIGAVFGGYALSKGGPAVRAGAVAAIAATDLSLLAFAATLPDITDNAADTAAPILVLGSDRHEFASSTVTVCGDIAGISAVCHLVAVATVICLGITAMCRERRPG
ncbi:hypothetical protein AB0L57_20015 [Nocardia sp. NPDC052254]|uniref:hypothetical protein n=1 Tax=Nocardia sp. NPDC052254 TaxID=3155681 RepID=UPI003425672E